MSANRFSTQSRAERASVVLIRGPAARKPARWRFALLLIAGVSYGGCVAARPFTLVKYDGKTDTFHELRIYADIAGGSADPNQKMSADGLGPIWRDRDRYIPILLCFYGKPLFSPNSGPNSGSAMLDFGLKRIGNGKYQFFGGEQPGPDDIFDRVLIKPGKLFFSRNKTLCYYHEVSLPGSALDNELRTKDAGVRQELKKQVEQEVARRQAGGRRGSWEGLQRELVADWEEWPMSDMTFEGKRQNLANPLTCLDESSLKMLLAAVKGGPPIASRKGGEIRLTWPLSADDCRRAKTTFDAVRERLLKRDSPKKPAEARAQNEKSPPYVSGLSQAAVATMLQATIEENMRFVVAVRVPPFIDLTHKAIRDAAPQPKKTADYQKAIAAMKAAGAAIDEKLTIDEVIREFKPKSP